MTIEFNTVEELAEAIKSAPVNMLHFTTVFLDSFGVSLCKTHQDLISNYDQKTAAEKEKIAGWHKQGDTVYAESDIPDWVAAKLAPETTHTATRKSMSAVSRNSYMQQHFASLPSGYQFDTEGFRFLFDRFAQEGYMSKEDTARWRRESGLYSFLYK